MKFNVRENVLVSITNDRGIITYVNDVFADASGFDAKELIGQNHRILKSGEQSDDVFIDLWHEISHGRPWLGTLKNRAKNGEYYYLATVILPVLNSSGKPQHYVSARYVVKDLLIPPDESLMTVCKQISDKMLH